MKKMYVVLKQSWASEGYDTVIESKILGLFAKKEDALETVEFLFLGGRKVRQDGDNWYWNANSDPDYYIEAYREECRIIEIEPEYYEDIVAFKDTVTN